MTGTGGTVAKLPVWRSVREAYGLVIRNFGFLLRVGWVWFLLLAAALTATRWVLSSLGFASADGDPSTFLEDYSAQIISASCLAVPAVLLTRRVLEHPYKEESAVDFRRICIVYAIASLTIWVVAFAPMMAMAHAAPGKESADSNEYEFLVVALAIVIVTVVLSFAFGLIVRSCLVLPSLAIDAADTTLQSSWRQTRGNSLRLTAILLATLLPSVTLGVIRAFTIDGFTNEFRFARQALLATYDAADGIAMLFPIALSAIAYRELVMKKSAG